MNVDDTNDRDKQEEPGEQPQAPVPEDTPPTEEQRTTPAEPPSGPAATEPRRLTRSRGDRVIGGVCGGLAKYFGIDPVIVRIVAVVTAFFGGAGILAYIAALLLVPDEDGDAAINNSTLWGKLVTGLGILLLVAAATVLLPWGWDWYFGGFLVPLAILGVIGYAVWSLAKGDRSRRAGDGAALVRTVLLGLALLAACAILAFAAGWAAAVGGDEVVAGLVIVAGGMLVAGAFLRPVRWLIAPALALAVPLAIVSAANIEVDNSIGERNYRPALASEIRDRYELGMGSLVVDLRGVDLPPGDRRIEMKVGVGEAVLVVPRDVCVASEAQIGIGGVDVFDENSGGIDVDWDDLRQANGGTTRVILDAEVGIGALKIGYDRDGFRGFRGFDERGNELGNEACSGSFAAAGVGNA